MSLFSPQFTSFGLDFSDGALKVVQIGKNISNQNQIKAWGKKTLLPGLLVNGEIKDTKKLAEEIKKTISEAHGKITTKYVVAALPENKTFIKFLSLKKDAPKISAPDLKKKLDAELPNHIPLSLDELRYDFQIISENNSSVEVIVAAIPINVCDAYATTFKQANLEVMALETEAQAITRAVFKSTQILNQKKKTPALAPAGIIIIADLGLTKSGLILWDKNTIQSTASLDLKSGELAQEIAVKLNIPEEKAKKALLVCGLDPKKGKGEVYRAMSGFFDELILEIQKTFEHHCHLSDSDAQTFTLLLVGENSAILGLKEYLREKINAHVIIGNPVINISVTPEEAFLHQAPEFTNAIGLALRHLEIDDV
jgi:type IV pilus assembly protein PilM